VICDNNNYFLSLIPKKENHASFNEFRPISLCNWFYKIIAKVMAVKVIKVFLIVIS
jgi:hypothetical protein